MSSNQFQLAFSHHQSGDLAKAETLYEELLKAEPEHADSLHLLGVVKHQRGDHAGGANSIRKAVSLQPKNASYLYNLGVIYQEMGNDKDAEATYRSTLAADPGTVSAWVNLGNILSRSGRFGEAGDCHLNALRIEPDNPEHHIRMGNTLKMQGYIENALAHYGNATGGSADQALVGSALLFASQYEPGINLEELSRRHSEWWTKYGAPLDRKDENKAFVTESKTLRIGFVSPDLGNHPVGIFLAPLIERLSKMENIETFCYADSNRNDEFSARIQAAADNWETIRNLSDDDVVSSIQGDRIEILFDLTGHTDDNRMPLFSRKPAPVQITWAGYVGSTGLETMDYILTDPFHLPEVFDDYYTEKPIRLRRDYICYEPPAYAPEVGPLPMIENGYPTFGCLNNPTKFSFPSIQIWSEILKQVPEARLLLKYKGVDDRSVRMRILGLFATQGVPSDRIELVGQTQHGPHLEYFNRVDVALDPFPYSSGLSACEAIWMGVPVVTCPGDTYASRHALSHLSNAGISGSIAEDWGEYVDLARGLVESPDKLAKIRSTMRTQVKNSPLCDLDGYAEDFVEAIMSVRPKSA